nr:ankyrin repeat domain-containing protein [Spirochaetota bacterium]
SKGWAALILASSQGRGPAVAALLAAKGIDVNARERDGRTALMWASYTGGDPGVVRALIAKGADVSLKDTKGRTALNYARGAKQTEIVGIIMAAGGK